jgi:hypothetical protein
MEAMNSTRKNTAVSRSSDQNDPNYTHLVNSEEKLIPCCKRSYLETIESLPQLYVLVVTSGSNQTHHC